MADERIQIQIAEGGLEARWKIEAGEALERDAVRAALDDAGVTIGIDPRLMLECEERIHDENFQQAETVIARGKAPVAGKDGQLELNFLPGPQAGRRRPDGSLDWLDRCWLTRVEAGHELAIILPPTNGRPGTRVDGQEIPTTPGKACSVATGDGVEVGDDGVIRSLREGAIQYREGEKVDVLEHYEHSGDVDIRSGHLSSDGTITVTGNVNTNFEVKSKGDIAINGAVFGGRVVAKGNVQIGRGISGGEDGYVEAGGDLLAHHAQSSRLHSGGAVVIATDCVGTQLHARKLEVGRALLGGESVVETLIVSRDVGSASGAGTMLQVGEPYESLREATRRKAATQKNQRTISRARKGRSDNSRTRIKRGRSSRDRLAIDREKTKQQREKVARRAELMKVAQIDVTGKVNVGVQIRFGNRRLVIDERLEATRFAFDAETRSITITRLHE